MPNYAQKKAEQFIEAAFNTVVHLYQQGLIIKERAQVSTARFTEFVLGNSELEAMRRDAREMGRKFILLLFVVVTAIIDYALTYQAFDILCATIGLPEFMKIIGPIMLVVLEILMCYSLFMTKYRRRSAYDMSLFDRVLPYSVIFIITGLSIGVIVYSISNFANQPEISFWTIISQITLWIGSVFLHICIIKSAVDIGEIITYQQYKIKWNMLAARKQRDQNKLNKVSGKFMGQTRGTIKDMYEYQSEFPNSTKDFSACLPTEVVNAINSVMGKNVFINQHHSHQIPS